MPAALAGSPPRPYGQGLWEGSFHTVLLGPIIQGVRDASVAASGHGEAGSGVTLASLPGSLPRCEGASGPVSGLAGHTVEHEALLWPGDAGRDRDDQGRVVITREGHARAVGL